MYITAELLEDFAHKYVDEDDKSLLETYCNAACEAVNEYLGYNPELATYTTKHKGDGGMLFALEAMPVTELTSIKKGSESLDVDDFMVLGKKNYIEADTAFASDTVYTVEYKAGYETVPYIIVLTALQIASLFWESAGGNLAVSSTSFADTGSRVFNNFTMDRFLLQLVNYKRVQL